MRQLLSIILLLAATLAAGRAMPFDLGTPGSGGSTDSPLQSATLDATKGEQGPISLEPLTPVETRHGTISIPEGWKLHDTSYTGDQITLNDPTGSLGIFILTIFRPEASEESVRERWQFKDRNPQPFQSVNGLKGLIAEGSHQPYSDRQLLAIGFWRSGLWEQVVGASAPAERFAEERALLERILDSYEPQPRGKK